jgi:hypothetical protein
MGGIHHNRFHSMNSWSFYTVIQARGCGTVGFKAYK